jgi:hypothetical protein
LNEKKISRFSFESYQSAQIGARETPKFRIGVFVRFDILSPGFAANLQTR